MRSELHLRPHSFEHVAGIQAQSGSLVLAPTLLMFKYFSQAQEPRGAIWPWGPPATFLELEGQHPQEEGWEGFLHQLLTGAKAHNRATRQQCHVAGSASLRWAVQKHQTQHILPPGHRSQKPTWQGIAKWGGKARAHALGPPRLSSVPHSQSQEATARTGRPGGSPSDLMPWPERSQNTGFHLSPHMASSFTFLLSPRWGRAALSPATIITHFLQTLCHRTFSIAPTQTYLSPQRLQYQQPSYQWPSAAASTPPPSLPVSLVTSKTKYPVTTQPVLMRSLCLPGSALTAVPLTLCMRIPLVSCAPKPRWLASPVLHLGATHSP